MTAPGHPDDGEPGRPGTDPAVLARLVALLGVTAPERWTWRGATVILYATGPGGVTSGVLHHMQDAGWAVPRAALYQLAAAHLGQQALPPPPAPAPGPAPAGEAIAAFCAAWESAGARTRRAGAPGGAPTRSPRT